jgi:hypothetical protein
MNCDRPGDQFGGNRGQNKVPTAKAAMAGSRRRANSHDFRFQAKAAPTLNFLQRQRRIHTFLTMA